MFAPGAFRLLNEERPLDWRDPGADRLWLYHLHYFDDLNSMGGEERRDLHEALIEDWVVKNPPGEGVGWEPYPLSRRVVNWIKWLLRDMRRASPFMIQSLAVQARFLALAVEYRVLGNHLLANAKALIFCGSFFAGAEADRLRHQGARLLTAELREQILEDGGHFERSPMYHVLALEDLLDVINLNRVYGGLLWSDSRGGDIPEIVERMRGWLRVMTHPDGEICLFNDAAFGVAPSPGSIDDYAIRLGLPTHPDRRRAVTVLPSSGYIRIERPSYAAFLDVGPIGPDYQPGHAHADTLSFEMSAHGRRVVVDSGVSCYTNTKERERQRSTAAHNTTVIDGEDSSEVWSAFRVGRGARPFGLSVAERQGAIEVKCGHDGYHRLKGKPTHYREWRFGADSATVRDRIVGPFRSAQSLFHFHPDLLVEGDPTSGALRLAGRALVLWTVLRGRATLTDATHHPEFGLSLPCRRLTVAFDGDEAATLLRIVE
jgi:uncharacterized heparinase superfamily protein